MVESLIGRSLREDETFSIRPVRLLKEGAAPRLASELADRLERHFAEVENHRPSTSEGGEDEALTEAMRSVRPGYTPQQ